MTSPLTAVERVKNAVRFAVAGPGQLKVEWKRQAPGWLMNHLNRAMVPKAKRKMLIEDLAWRTDQQGEKPLAKEYSQPGATRRPNQVRSSPVMGDVFAWLAETRRPRAIVEFGTAFGFSGMYWLSGLEAAGSGHLYSFEINPIWAEIAKSNLGSIGTRFTLTVGSFEDNVDRVVPQPIDIAFVDGIHTYEWVTTQYSILKRKVAPGAILLFDDIDFATGRMRECWEDIATDKDVTAACELNDHVGVIELGETALSG
jgi:predicted O-methyltransferase YrrM